MKKKASKLSPFHKYLIVTLIIITGLLLGLIYFIGILPFNYFIFATAIAVFVDGLLILKIVNGKKRVFPALIVMVLIVVMMIGVVYEMNTIDFLKKLGYHVATQNYSVVVLKTSNYNELNDLTDKNMGLLSNYNDAIRELEKMLIFQQHKYEDIDILKDALINKEVDGILVESSLLAIIREAKPDFDQAIKVIKTYDIETITRDIKKDVNIEKNAFNIYVSGIDTYGSIGSLARSDVNIVVTVNPKTQKIHITNIPRDYYVKLHSKNGYNDKLTHAGIYGIEESVATIEDLLDIDINYFVKVNFSSLIDIVDAIGPIEVYSDYAFTSGIYDDNSESYEFSEGLNTLNGAQALAFSRERKSFIGGDRVRNENQEKVLEAIIKRALSPVILTKYSTLLDALSKSFVTNLAEEEITSFIKMQIDNSYDWQITNYVLDGTDATEFTYTYSSEKLYVMEPSQYSVNKAKSLIAETINN